MGYVQQNGDKSIRISTLTHQLLQAFNLPVLLIWTLCFFNMCAILWSNVLQTLKHLNSSLRACSTNACVRYCNEVPSGHVDPHIAEFWFILTQIAKFMGPTWAHLGPVGPRWASCWPHEPCYQDYHYPLRNIVNNQTVPGPRLLVRQILRVTALVIKAEIKDGDTAKLL